MKSLHLICRFGLTMALVFAPAAFAEDRSAAMDELLQRVKAGAAKDAQVNQQRIREFQQAQAQQQALLSKSRDELSSLEQQSAAKEGEFQANEATITELQDKLNTRMGDLRELFGVLQQVAGDTKGIVENSVISSQIPGRGEFLSALISKAGSSHTLPDISELERLWYEIQREMVETGRVVRYDAEVVSPEGGRENAEVVRVGAFNVIQGDRYLNWEPESASLVQLARQPAGRYVSTASGFANAAPGEMTDFWLDPSRGALLSMLIRAPDLKERVEQGGTVGYLILGLGCIALLIALERLVTLNIIGRKVKRQVGASEVSDNNPLGRIIQVYRDHRTADMETLEMKLGEAVMGETPRLVRFLALLKTISVVAPLMGLLGTVTGMINTFQAMTLFGTGDPKLMAGGISQALVTTVLGLVVAIPTVLLHTLVSGRSKEVVQILEKQAVGIIAEHAEREGAHG